MTTIKMGYCIGFVKYEENFIFYGPKCSDFQTILFNERKVKFLKVYALCPAGEDERDGLSVWVLSYSGKRRAGSENPEAREISFLQEWVTSNVVETNWKNLMFLREMLIPVVSQETK